MWWFSGRGVVWVGLDRCGPALPVPVCAWSVGLRGFGGEVEDPYARVRRGRCRYLGRTGVSACRCSRVPGGRGMVGVAHLRVLCVGGSRGIMWNSTVSSGRSPVPMCAGPPDRTWEPDHHTRRSPEKPTIPTKTSPHPAEVPVSCVQYRGQPHPLGTSGSLTTNPPQIRTGTRPILNAECGVSGHLRQFECLRCSDCGEVVSRLVGGY